MIKIKFTGKKITECLKKWEVDAILSLSHLISICYSLFLRPKIISWVEFRVSKLVLKQLNIMLVINLIINIVSNYYVSYFLIILSTSHCTVTKFR